MTRLEFIEVLKKSENSFHQQLSHLYGSDYYTVNGYSVRISDHAKNKNSFGYAAYLEGNDFSNYEDALIYLSSKLDMSDKTEARNLFYQKNEKHITKIDENTFKTPYGRMFSSIDCALNNWWRTKKDFKI